MFPLTSNQNFTKRRQLTSDTQGADIVAHITREMNLHISYCREFGISLEEIESTEEHQGQLPVRYVPCLIADKHSKQHVRPTQDTCSTLARARTGLGSSSRWPRVC
jgi:hypothetical protein